MKINVSAVRNHAFRVVLLIITSLIVPVTSHAADTPVAPNRDAAIHAKKASEPAYVQFNVEFDNRAGTTPLLFQIKAVRCVTGNFPHVITVNPGESPAFTMKTVNVNRCLDVTKYLMWDVTPQTGASVDPYRLKFIHGRNGDWGTTINVDGNIPSTGAVQTATCNSKNCLKEWVYGSESTFVIVGFH